MLWCAERCNKADMKELRQGLTECVEKEGGQITRFRRASQFEQSLAEEPPTAPWALLTAWRETKPCLEVRAASSAATAPSIHLVYTDGEKQFLRASQWHNEELPEEMRSRVRVLSPIHAVEEIVRLAKLYMHGDSDDSQDLLRLNLNKVLHDVHLDRKQREAAAFEQDWREQQYMGRPCETDSLFCAHRQAAYPAPALPIDMAQMPFYACRVGGWQKPVADIIAPVVSWASSAEVQQMLTAAMPDRYED